MDPLVPLSLGVLLGFSICFAFSDIFVLFTGIHKDVIDDTVLREESNLEKTSDRCARSTRIFIPNVLARWPWPRRINPNYVLVSKETGAWATSLGAFSPKAQDAFNRINATLLACLAYPNASKEHVRAGCDFMHLLFIYDEYLDRFPPDEVRKQKDVILDALRNPHKPRPKGEWIGGEATRQFWRRIVQCATEVSQKRFMQSIDDYIESIVQESIGKRNRRILDVNSYIEARRLTGAVKPSFSIAELGLDIPDDVMAHPAIQEMIIAAIDIVAIFNDIVSYNVEQKRDDAIYNIITSVMKEHHTDVNGAILWSEHFILEAEHRFLTALAALPEWEEPLNSQVREYCEGLGYWVRANYDWSFESERYLGDKGLEIERSRWVYLSPKKRLAKIGPGSLL